DERRLLNRLRADLIATFPAALTIAGDDMGAPTFLRMLERWPTANALAAASRDDLIAFARAGRHGWPDRFADQAQAALSADNFVARDWLVRAKTDTIRLLATQLLALGAERRNWERRMGELLLGAPRTGRNRQPNHDQRGPAVPGGEIYLSSPGLGDRLAARVAGEIGDIANFDTPNGLQCYAGKAPATRRSGKSELVVANRLACNGHLRDAVQQWAFCSLRGSGWARQFYDTQRARRRATTPPSGHWATAGSRCSGTASPTASPTTRTSTPPTATATAPRPPHDDLTLVVDKSVSHPTPLGSDDRDWRMVMPGRLSGVVSACSTWNIVRSGRSR
ncbi:MAG: IS110 family transposase, partial [Acidimicrobiales bacterium]